MQFLQVSGKYIVNERREKVFLRGVCFGGWLNMENFIIGYPGTESNVRRAVRDVLGEERYQAFFESLLESFITEGDFKFLKEKGATVVRVPFNYRHFEDDMNPGVYDKKGFRFLDRAIEFAKKHGIYVILDLHAAPGWQNQGWHSDNPHAISLMWTQRHYQERVTGLWRYIADHYKNEPAVAGYNLLNEPNAPNFDILNRLYREWVGAIRDVDKRHLIFLEGNTYSQKLDGLDDPFDDNLVYSCHNYSLPTHRATVYPGTVFGIYADAKHLEEAFLQRAQWMLDKGVPGWVGEFGALYDNGAANPSPSDLARLKALEDQLQIFNKYDQHWTIWTYKDVDVQGLAVPKADSEYMCRIRPILEMKKNLGLDGWTTGSTGTLTTKISQVVDLMMVMLKDSSLDAMGLKRSLGQEAVYGTIASFLAPLYALRFRDMSVDEIRQMHEEAFVFENCQQRDYLVDALEKAFKG